ncbi:MAG: hypothetical protein OXT68_10130 [Chloroflexota bacterium]|nr:hypothetical protein [Chloroflexota bacterium]
MTAEATTRQRAIDRIRSDDRSPMENLPYWARATNPIVRRHLGLYWRTLPPEFEPILYICGFWLVTLVLGIFFPFITDLATTVIVVSVLVIPVGMIFYLRALFSVAANSASAMADEIRNNTMQLLMSTPMSLDQIFLGKVAASLWRKMDDLILIVQGAAIFGPPLIIMHYAGLFPLRESGPVTYLLIIAMTLVSMLRLVLEPVMFGMVGVGIGAFVPFRSIAMTSSVAFVAFYFLLMIMLQQLNIDFLAAALDAAKGATESTLDVANLRLGLAVGSIVLVELLLPLLVPFALIRLVIGLLTRQLREG